MEKTVLKIVFFFIWNFEGILEGFWTGFGRLLGGVLEVFFATCEDFFQFAWTFLDFFSFWKENLLKFTPCGGLKALEEDFGIHLGGYLAWKSVKLGSILSEKVDRRREWHAKLNEGVNGALTYKTYLKIWQTV